MDNIESFWPSIQKLLENLLLTSIEGDYDMELVKYPNFSKYFIQIDVNVNVGKLIQNHEEYDSVYSKTMWNLDDITEKVYKYLGLSREKLQIDITPNYYNYDFLEDEIFLLQNNLISGLKENGTSDERIEELDLWTNLYLREDDYPYFNIEVGTAGSPTTEEINFIEDLSYSLLDKTNYSKYVVDDFNFWFDY